MQQKRRWFIRCWNRKIC